MKQFSTTEKVLMGVGAAVLLSAAAYGVVTLVRRRKASLEVLEFQADDQNEEETFVGTNAPAEAQAEESPEQKTVDTSEA